MYKIDPIIKLIPSIIYLNPNFSDLDNYSETALIWS